MGAGSGGGAPSPQWASGAAEVWADEEVGGLAPEAPASGGNSTGEEGAREAAGRWRASSRSASADSPGERQWRQETEEDGGEWQVCTRGGTGRSRPHGAAAAAARTLATARPAAAAAAGVPAARKRAPSLDPKVAVASAARQLLQGRERDAPGQKSGHHKIVWYDGSWSCGKCGATHPVDQRCPLGVNPPCRSYLMGRCQTGVGCGVAHPPIELDSDAFPADLPWQEVAVVPPGALQGRSAAQWRTLLRRHAAAAPAPGITSQLGHLAHRSGGVDAADEQPSARSKLRGQGGPAPPNLRAKEMVTAATSADRLAASQQAERRARSAQRAAADVAAAAQAMLQGRPRDSPGQAKEFRSKVIWFNGMWECKSCGGTHDVQQSCSRGDPPCRPYLMGCCVRRGKHGGRGRPHPPIELPPDCFPSDLPWEQVVVLPPGALVGPAAAQWTALLRRHAARGRTAAAAPGTAEAAASSPRPAAGVQQAATLGGAAGAWYGEWLCDCGAVNGAEHGCKACGAKALCRRWMATGHCPHPSCRHRHPANPLPPAAATTTGPESTFPPGQDTACTAEGEDPEFLELLRGLGVSPPAVAATSGSETWGKAGVGSAAAEGSLLAPVAVQLAEDDPAAVAVAEAGDEEESCLFATQGPEPPLCPVCAREVTHFVQAVQE